MFMYCYAPKMSMQQRYGSYAYFISKSLCRVGVVIVYINMELYRNLDVFDIITCLCIVLSIKTIVMFTERSCEWWN